jgi:hypothetical protein
MVNIQTATLNYLWLVTPDFILCYKCFISFFGKRRINTSQICLRSTLHCRHEQDGLPRTVTQDMYHRISCSLSNTIRSQARHIRWTEDLQLTGKVKKSYKNMIYQQRGNTFYKPEKWQSIVIKYRCGIRLPSSVVSSYI